MGAFWAMVWNGYREARRNRVTVVVGVFAIGILLCTNLVTAVTVNTFSRVITDFGLGTMSLILVFLSIYLSSGLLTREIERRTIFLVVSKPVSRAKFLIARLCGNMLTLGLLLVAMFAVFTLELLLFHDHPHEPQLAAAAGLWFELCILTAVGFLLSSFSSQVVSAVGVAGIYVAGHLSADIYRLADRSKSHLLAAVGKGLFYLLPNLELVNFKPLASYAVQVPSSLFIQGAAYAMGYTVVVCALAVAIFNRRDFR